MFEQFLPIGSVVLLKESTKKLMITGIMPVSQDDPNNPYDYIGVFYPEGFLSNEYTYLFNHSDINDIVFYGYQNPERADFLMKLEESFNAASGDKTEDGEKVNEENIK